MSNSPISQNQEIFYSSLEKLIFEPEKDWFGITKFSWKASDGKLYSRNEAEIHIEILSINDPPLINDFLVTGNEDETVWFRKFDFLWNFKDVEND